MEQRWVAGIADHMGWAVAVVADARGTVAASRRIELVAPGLTVMPYHGPGQRLPLDQAVALAEQVAASAAVEAAARLAELAALVPGLGALALREIPSMPGTVAACLQDYWAQTRADGVLYRRALAQAAEDRGWPVHWFAAKATEAAARAALGSEALAAAERAARSAFGPPWTADHRLALNAAIVAAHA